MKRILFISWDGPFVTYLEGLFLPILSKLNASGFEFHVIHFTWADEEVVHRISLVAREAKVPYTQVIIPKWPFDVGKIFILVRGPGIIREYIQRNNIHWLMPRTMMPARMAIAVMRKVSGLSLIFDADGLPIEERVDFAGLRPGGLRYRFLKRIERTAIQNARLVLVRSNSAIEILGSQYGFGSPYYKVINGRSEHLFRPVSVESMAALRGQLKIPLNAFVMIYSGSLGQPYCVEEMIMLHKMVLKKRPDSWLVVLTGNPSSWPGQVPNTVVRKVGANDVPEYLSIADVALALRRQKFSMRGVAPIKLGEYLLCGLPVVATAGIGDTEDLLRSQSFCHILHSLDEQALFVASDWMMKATKKQAIREFGMKHFGLEIAVSSYHRALSEISE